MKNQEFEIETFEALLDKYVMWFGILEERERVGCSLFNAPANTSASREALITYVKELHNELSEERNIGSAGWREAGFWETRVAKYEKLISRLFDIKGVLNGPKYLKRLEEEVKALQEHVMTPEQAAFLLAIHFDHNPNFAGTIQTAWYTYVKRTTREITGKLRSIAADYYTAITKDRNE